MRDHQGLIVGNFRGTFDRGEEETVPLGYFLASQNIRFIKGGVTTRYGSSQSLTLASVRRVAAYERTGEAKRLLLLDGSGNLYDSTDLATPILSIAAMSDFSAVTIFGRSYITPHNGLTGLPGEKVYVYNGTTVRAAAGVVPSQTPMVAVDSASTGTVEPGQYVLAVLFETASGFLTSPGGWVSFTAVGEKKIDLSSIPTGVAGTAARVIIATKLLSDYAGDYSNQTFYFVPNGRIGNNTATTFTIDFYEDDLKEAADYILEQLDVIPAGVGIGLIEGRMLVWGEDANPSIVRISEPGEPESHNSIEGFITVNPGDAGGGVRNCVEYRTQLIMFKHQRSYSCAFTQDRPAFWEVIEIDSSVGTECHGIPRALDGGHTIEDYLFVVDSAGLRLFNGLFLDANILSYAIDDIWGRINPPYFHTVEIAVDPIESIIYVAVPLDAETSPNKVLVGDYSEGLTPEDIRWTIYSFPQAAQTIIVDTVAHIPTFKFGALAGNVYKLDPTTLNDTGVVAIDHFVEFSYLPPEDLDDTLNHFTGARFKIKGDGTLAVTGKSLDGALTFTGENIVLSTSPGRPLFSGFNFTSERVALKVRLNSAGKYFTMTKYTMYLTPEWAERPR